MSETSNQRMSDNQWAVTIVAVILVLLIGGAVFAVGVYQSVAPRSRTSFSGPVVITGVVAKIIYSNPSANYFGTQSQSLDGSGFPLVLDYNQMFYYKFTLRMGGYSETHTVDNISLTTPGFAFISVNPYTPYAMSSGSSANFTITANAAWQSYYGSLTITISTH